VQVVQLRNKVVLHVQDLEAAADLPERLDALDLLLMQRDLLERRDHAFVVLRAAADHLQGDGRHRETTRRGPHATSAVARREPSPLSPDDSPPRVRVWQQADAAV
jgi:hypothetical protein